jgi:hypothetical protein
LNSFFYNLDLRKANRNRVTHLESLSQTGYIIEMPESYFTPEPDKDGQVFEYISLNAIPVSECRTRKVQFADALKQGLQIFFIKQDADLNRIRATLLSMCQSPRISNNLITCF